VSVAEHAVARLSDIDDPGALESSVGVGDWPFRGLIVRWQGRVFAYVNICPHQRHPLNLTPRGFFTPDRDALICSSHGARFAPDTGLCIRGPCSGRSLDPLPCRVDGDTVRVTLPDPPDRH
jgi:nitrite reductase/ring-hydroxylating ferredoxin subunit